MAGSARDFNLNADRVNGFIVRIDQYERFDAAFAEAQKALDANRFDDARRFVAQAREQNVNAADAAGLARKIQRVQDLTSQVQALIAAKSVGAMSPAVDRLAELHPRSPTLAEARSLINAAATDDEKERLGLREFYRGDYSAAVQALSTLTGSGRPRAHLYLASSKAALARLETDPERSKKLEEEARKHLEPLKDPRRAFSADLRYLSPAVIAILGLAGS